MRVLVIGAGKMVEAIMSGLSGHNVTEWGILSKNGKSASELASKTGLKHVLKVKDYPNPDWILIGCKPQQIKEIQIPDVPVMSLLAAIPEKTQKDILKVTHLVRVMPNLPVKHRKGVSLISSSSKDKVAWPAELFQKMGVVKVVTEAELAELTLLTGSGPALFYEFTKCLAENFSSLSQSEREELAKSVLMGAAASVREEELGNLIDAVTSKGGVTIAVLEEWRKNGLSDVLKSGVTNGLKRTEELKALLLQN